MALALGALAFAGVVSANTLQGANWSFALLFGILASISVIFTETGLDRWFAHGVYHGTDGQFFSHAQAAPMAIAYAVVTVLALLASVPVWETMGLL